jgi:bacteriocin-like protein
MRRDRSMKKLVLTRSTLRQLSDNELNSVAGGETNEIKTGSCEGGQLSCCRTFKNQQSCDSWGTIPV